MSDRRDFFISFNGADLAHAEAIDAALRMAGFTTYFHPRDLKAGGNIAMWMDDALMNSAQTLALYSPNYVADRAVYSKAERYATWWQDPGSDKRKLIPVMLAETQMSPLMAPIKYIDVKDKSTAVAAAAVIAQLKLPREEEQRDLWQRAQPLPAIFNAPYRPNPNFTGRFEALELLHRALRDGPSATITAVSGMAGIGKTTLAAEYCHRFGGHYEGVWWIRCEQRATMLQDIASLGERLSINSDTSVETLARATIDRLASGTEPWLVVYDNAPDADSIESWLPAGRTRGLITSRRGDFDHISAVMRIDLWSEATTIDYLLSRTGRKDRDGASALASVLGGLPLAAEQAASFLQTRSLVSFEEYIADILRLIKREKPKGAQGSYTDTVYAAFVKSLDAVADAGHGRTALAMLQLCSYLSRDGVDLELIDDEKVHGFYPEDFARALSDKLECADALALLNSYSLMHEGAGPAGPVLIFHRLLLEVARDRLSEDDKILWSSAAAEVVSRAFPHATDGYGEVCARLMPHVSVLETVEARTDALKDALGTLFQSASLYLSELGYHKDALKLVKKTVELRRSRRAEHPAWLASALGNLGHCLADLGRYDEAETAYREAIALKEASPCDDHSLSITLSNLAELYLRQNKFSDAEMLVQRALMMARENREEAPIAFAEAIADMGRLYFDRPEKMADVEWYLIEALNLTAEACGYRAFRMIDRYHSIGVFRMRQGSWKEAARWLEFALAIRVSLNLSGSPDTENEIWHLTKCWEELGGREEDVRKLRDYNFGPILAVILKIEMEHRKWIEKDPEKRHFGARSAIWRNVEFIDE